MKTADPMAWPALRLLNVLSLLAWPFIVLLVMTHPHWHYLFYPLCVLFTLRWWTLRRRASALSQLNAWLALCGALFSLNAGALHSLHMLLWYPVLINMTLFTLFATSLRGPMPLAERIARLREPDLPPRAVTYTRQVTCIWCLFFIFNGAIALATCLNGDIHVWTLWNGMISYVLIGALMTGEWLMRQRIRRQA